MLQFMTPISRIGVRLMLLHSDSAEVFPKFSFAILDVLHSYAIDYTTVESTKTFGAHPKTTQVLSPIIVGGEGVIFKINC